jgi:hypothetical protein
MNEILSAFDNMTSSAGDKWFGVSQSGMPITGIVDQVTGKIKTAYPNIVFPPPQGQRALCGG